MPKIKLSKVVWTPGASASGLSQGDPRHGKKMAVFGVPCAQGLSVMLPTSGTLSLPRPFSVPQVPLFEEQRAKVEESRTFVQRGERFTNFLSVRRVLDGQGLRRVRCSVTIFR